MRERKRRERVREFFKNSTLLPHSVLFSTSTYKKKYCKWMCRFIFNFRQTEKANRVWYKKERNTRKKVDKSLAMFVILLVPGVLGVCFNMHIKRCDTKVGKRRIAAPALNSAVERQTLSWAAWTSQDSFCWLFERELIFWWNALHVPAVNCVCSYRRAYNVCLPLRIKGSLVQGLSSGQLLYKKRKCDYFFIGRSIKTIRFLWE